MTTLYHAAVWGSPIAHSKSPEIHQFFASASGISLIYDKREVNRDTFAEAWSAFEGVGLNVTYPLKQLALTKAARLSEAAQQVGAVNTLIRHDNEYWGDNTDIAGFAYLLQHLESLGKTIDTNHPWLILGSGGAASAAACALRSKGLSVWCMSRCKTDLSPEATQLFDGRLNWGQVEGMSELPNYAGIINAWPSQHLPPKLPETIQAQYWIDLNYHESLVTPWLEQNAQRGLLIDGKRMLLGQAAHAFQQWFGILPDIEAAYQALFPDAQ